MTSAPFLIILDDKRTDFFTFGPKNWTTSTSAPWFNGTEQVPDFASAGSNDFGTIFMKFQGTYVAFFGITPTPFTGSEMLTVSIDGSEPTSTSYDDPNPPSYRQWYQSPTLTEGSHNISLSHIAGTSLDFAVVAVGQNTPLAGQIAIVDNEDPSIMFNGSWKRAQWSFKSGQNPGGLPFHNSTQDSTTIGDNMTFLFTGQSAAIYGIFTWSNLGLITLTFTLDGASLSRTFQVTPSTPQFQTQFGQQQNFQFISYDYLSPGNHILTINVTDCVNQTFSLDYITFVPSFSTLANRPNLTLPTNTAFGDLGPSRSKLSAGAIAGIVISAIVVLLGCVLFFKWKPWKKRSEHKLVNPFLPGQRDTGTIPLRGLHLSAPRSLNTISSRYTPTLDTQVTVGGPRATYISVDPLNSSRHASVVSSYDQYVFSEDNVAVTEGAELISPPSYIESTNTEVVNLQ